MKKHITVMLQSDSVVGFLKLFSYSWN